MSRHAGDYAEVCHSASPFYVAHTREGYDVATIRVAVATHENVAREAAQQVALSIA